MRWAFALLILSPSFLGRAFGEDSFPYKAIVTKADTAVRSGPGRGFYVTDKLPEGATVEVYRHDLGGWCAIRPPEGSFSWVRARYLDIKENNIATINTEDVVARVGSSEVEARDVIQVHLEKGEAVELVDGDEPKPGPWRKIAPPSGEFRWVALDAIERTDEPILLADAEEEVVDDSMAEATPAGFEDELAPDPTIVPEEEEPLPRRRRRFSHVELQQEIIDIDLELSTRAANEITTWDFDDLHRRAERALEGAPTALDRAAVRELMGKIDRFEKIADQNFEIELAQAKATRSMVNEQGGPELLAEQGIDTSRFDGTGRLARVVSKNPNSPKYALIDDTGKVMYYINAAPGINLTPFLNKEVGVNGTRGTIAARQRQVLSAQRITELSQPRRRY